MNRREATDELLFPIEGIVSADIVTIMILLERSTKPLRAFSPHAKQAGRPAT
jgi:hypothetical protein